jgi:hypothetical protein
VEEIAGEHGRCLGGEELAPGGVVAARRRWWYAQAFEDPPDRGGTDPVAEAEQFALDSLVAPAGIVSGHLLNQGGNGRVDRRPAGPVREGPVAGDQPSMPPQDRGRGDQPVCLQRPGEEPGQRGEHRPVGPVQPRLWVLPAQDRVLVTKNQDLHVFGRTGTGEESKPAGDAAEREVEQAQRHAS